MLVCFAILDKSILGGIGDEVTDHFRSGNVDIDNNKDCEEGWARRHETDRAGR
jgi:hypothetical protein